MCGWFGAGKVLNYAGVSVLTPAEMSASARRVLRFIDLGGHEKYLKTALYGMTCMVPPKLQLCCNSLLLLPAVCLSVCLFVCVKEEAGVHKQAYHMFNSHPIRLLLLLAREVGDANLCC